MAWRRFCQVPANKKVSYTKLFKIYDSILKNGQKVEFPVVFRCDKYFVAGGATRLSSLIAIGTKTAKVEVRNNSNKWNDAINLNTHHFLNIPQETIDDFLIYCKRINRDFDVQSVATDNII